MPPPGPPPPQMSMAMPPPLPPPSNLELEERQIEEKIQALRNQITESESNLKAHEVNLNVQKQVKKFMKIHKKCQILGKSGNPLACPGGQTHWRSGEAGWPEHWGL